MVILRYADEKIKKSVEKLGKKDEKFFRHVKNALMNIKGDRTCGIRMPTKLIPKEWKKRYRINNLYKYNLPNSWRLIYSLVGEEVEIMAIILGCYTHKEYERLSNF